MHEQSRTYERNGRYVNVAGTTRQVLSPRFPFEARSYSNLAQALFAARMRSEWTGKLGEQYTPLETLETAATNPRIAALMASIKPTRPSMLQRLNSFLLHPNHSTQRRYHGP